MINPVFFAILDRMVAKEEAEPQPIGPPDPAKPVVRDPPPVSELTNHVILVGHGRVGSVVSTALRAAKMQFLVIEDTPGVVERLRESHVDVITGNAAAPDMLQAANIAQARGLLVAIPDAFEGGQIVAKARALNPTLPIIARAHSDEEVAHLKYHGAHVVIMGEQERKLPRQCC